MTLDEWIEWRRGQDAEIAPAILRFLKDMKQAIAERERPGVVLH